MGVFISREWNCRWRDIPSDNSDNLKFVKEFHSPHGSVDHVRILLHGPVGAGKSAFINSVSNVIRGRVTSQTLSDGMKGKSFTRKYTTHKIWKSTNHSCDFVFNDIMGLEDAVNAGIHADDIKSVLKGHVRDGYQFDPDCKIVEGNLFYNPAPTFSDQVHVLVSVFPADKAELSSHSVLRKMREIRLAASEMAIPQMAIITKIDEVQGIQGYLKYAYDNRTLKEKVDTLSKNLGIPPNCIFLVKNYHSETKLMEDINALILLALRQMVEFGEDFIQRQFVE